MSAARQFFDAIDQSKRGRARPTVSASPRGEGDGGGERLAPVMPPATALRQYIGTALLGVHEHELGVVLELAPRGHMSRRWVLIEGATNITDITLDDEATKADDDQAQIDIGDDMYERERYATGDIDLTGEEDDPRTRRR